MSRDFEKELLGDDDKPRAQITTIVNKRRLQTLIAVGLLQFPSGFLRALLISQGLEAETYAIDMIKDKNSTYHMTRTDPRAISLENHKKKSPV